MIYCRMKINDETNWPILLKYAFFNVFGPNMTLLHDSSDVYLKNRLIQNRLFQKRFFT